MPTRRFEVIAGRTVHDDNLGMDGMFHGQIVSDDSNTEINVKINAGEHIPVIDGIAKLSETDEITIEAFCRRLYEVDLNVQGGVGGSIQSPPIRYIDLEEIEP